MEFAKETTTKEIDYDKVIKWSYTLAREWAIKHLVPQGVTSARKFEAYKRSKQPLPLKYPRIPDEYFIRRGSWKGWKDFLGNPDSNKKKTFLDYKDAARIARSAKICNSTEYREWKKRPYNLPARPELQYKDEWKGWSDFLGSRYKKIDNSITYSKLKESDVRIIKHQLKLGISGAYLAKTFGVSEMQISRIKSGENWAHIEV